MKILGTKFHRRSIAAAHAEVDRVRNTYEGAKRSITRSFIHAPVQSVRKDITKFTRLELVRKSRFFEKNSELYNNLADKWEQYTVGTGLQFFPASGDARWNTAAAVTWENWKPLADVSSRFSFDTLQGVISRAVFVDGEIFVLLTRDPGNNRPRIQLLESHLCETPPQHQAREGKSICDGVEIDPSGRPLGYWFRMEEDRYHLFDAWQVVHIFEPSRASQLRGIPYIACAINTLHDMDDLALLEMRHAKAIAENSLIVNTASGELPPGMMGNPLASKFQAGGQALSTGEPTTEERVEYYEHVQGARVRVGMIGDKIEEIVSDRPSVATREYWRLLAEKVCAGVGIPYVLIYPDSMQGTVYRGALDCANAFFRAKSAVFAQHFQRLFEFVMNMEASFTPILANRPADWRRIVYQAPRAVNVDVGRNSAAMLAELESGATNFAQIYGEIGKDWKVELRQKAEEAKYIREIAREYQVDVSEISVRQVDRPDRAQTAPMEAQEEEEEE